MHDHFISFTLSKRNKRFLNFRKKLRTNVIKIRELLTHVVENQVFRSSVVLLEGSICRCENRHVTIRERGICHLTCFQQLVELQQKRRYTFITCDFFFHPFINRTSHRAYHLINFDPINLPRLIFSHVNATPR